MRKIGMIFLLFVGLVHATKIKDITEVVGVRDNQLIGYGLVVGLNGTGDGTTSEFTSQSLANMLESMNITTDITKIKPKNVAAVVVTAKFDAFARQGDKITVNISSIGDSKSIQGGTLIMTPLKGVDGKIYAIAQGPISIGGKNGRGAGDLNHPTAGIIFKGATIEREMSYDLYSKQYGKLSLKDGSLSNAIAIQKTLNSYYKTEVAVATDPKTIKLKKPSNISMIEFLAQIENLDVEYKIDKKIIINERTGTIIAGIDIAVMPVVISHGEITIKIEEQAALQDPDEQNILLDENVLIGLQDQRVKVKNGGNTVANIARSLKKLGATPKDIIAILESMKEAGAISADLEII
jgi:flagellar P-ring protein precursor FlgI